MGQLLSLMVLGDMVAANADGNQQQQVEQNAAGNSSICAQYRTAHGDGGDDIDWETDEDRYDVQHTGSTDTGIVTLRWSCNDRATTSTERRQEDNFDEDGAGQHSGELHYDPPSPGSWSCSVHTHRTGLDGSERPVVGSRNWGQAAEKTNTSNGCESWLWLHRNNE